MFTKRKLIILIAVAALLAGAVGWYAYSEREPRFEGRSLSEWIDDIYKSIYLEDGPNPTRIAAEHAIRQIGTNAIPLYLEWIRYEPPHSQGRRFEFITERLPESISPIDVLTTGLFAL